MGVNAADIAAYINEAVRLRAVTPTASVVKGTVTALGLRQKLALVAEAVPATGTARKISFVKDEVPFTVTKTVQEVTVDGTEAVLPSIFARKQIIYFNANGITTGDKVKIGDQTFEFSVSTVSTDASNVLVSVGTGSATVAAYNLYTKYNAFPDIATATLASGSPTITFEHATLAFCVSANNSAKIDQSGSVFVRDGAGSIELRIDAGAAVTVDDEIEVTFGPVTRNDGRVFDAVTSTVTVV